MRMSKKNVPVQSASRVVAVSGAATFLGSRLVQTLEDDRRYTKIVAIDEQAPDHIGPTSYFCQLDLTKNEAGTDLHKLFQANKVDTLVHLAFQAYPTHNSARDHELHVIGTMQLLYAAAAAGLRKVVMLGSTMSYGARIENPQFIKEEHPLQGGQHDGYVHDLVEAERQLEEFSKEHPAVITTVLRMANPLGPHSDSFLSRLLRRGTVPTVLGYDPMLQFLHEDDAVAALKHAVDQDLRGPFNIVAEGAVPLLTVLRLGGQASLPLLTPVAKHVSYLLWAIRAVDLYPEFIDYLRYPWIGDGDRARSLLGFSPQHTSRETLLDFIQVTKLNQAPRPKTS
jgi:UDP-glucose 4-epimerase